MTNKAPGARLSKSIAIVFFASGMRWILSCIKIIIIASLFGTTFAYDAYLVAFAIPEMITGLLVGVIAVTFIPIFTDYFVKEGDVKALDFASNLMSVFFIIGLLLTFITIVLAPLIVRLAAPGFNQETFRLAVRLIIIIFPIILIVTLTEIVARILQAYGHFIVPSLGNVLEVGVVIASLYFLSNKFGIFSLACGLLLGVFVKFIFQFLFLCRKVKHFHFRFGFNFRLPGIEKFSRLAAPLISCMLFLRIGTVIERLLASTLKEGSISILGYATALTDVPSEIFLSSIGIVLFPLISKYASEGKIADFKTVLSKGIRMGNFILVPIAVIFIFFGKQIIQSLLERGKFVSSMTHDTSIALALYALSLFAMGIYFFSAQACYAIQEINATLKIAIFFMILSTIFKVIIINYLSFAGLALVTSVALIFQSGFLMKFLIKKIGSLDGKIIAVSSFKILTASILMALACWLALRLVPAHTHKLIKLSTLLFTAGISYFVFSYLLRSKELATLKDLIKTTVL